MEEFNLELFREFDCSDCLEFRENSEIPAAFLDDEEAATSLPEALKLRLLSKLAFIISRGLKVFFTSRCRV
jgi:hypothetical protein